MTIDCSIVIPAYNEETGIASLTQRLDEVMASWGELRCEVIIVDDHSTDKTPQLLAQACQERADWKYLRLARNSGSHLAITAGLSHAQGACAIFLAADLQDPPELIPELIARWRAGKHIVWAVREKRLGIPWSEKLFANTFYWLLNRISRIQLPPSGSDFVLMDRAVYTALAEVVGPHPVLMGEIAALGFSQEQVLYTKEERLHGSSHWNLRLKIRAALNAIIAFSYAPLRAMVGTGIVAACTGIIYAIIIIVRWMAGGQPAPGWSSLMVVILLVSGVQMGMLGILGEYLWRTLEESKRRPRFLIEDRAGFEESAPP